MLPHLWLHFPRFELHQWATVWEYQMEQFTSFHLCTLLRSVIRISRCLAHIVPGGELSLQHVHTASTILAISHLQSRLSYQLWWYHSTATVSNWVMAPNARTAMLALGYTNRSWKVDPWSEKLKGLNQIRKEKKSILVLLKSATRLEIVCDNFYYSMLLESFYFIGRCYS